MNSIHIPVSNTNTQLHSPYANYVFVGKKKGIKHQIYKFAVLFVISFFILLIIPDYQQQTASQEWCRQIALISLGMLLFQIFSLRWMMLEFRFLPLMFLIILYMFNFPQVILYGFDLEQVERHQGYSSIFYYNNVPQAVDLAFKSITGIFLGMSLILIRQAKWSHSSTNDKVIKLYRLPAIIIIFTLGFIADLVCNVFVVLTMGYASMESVPYMNIVRYFSLLLPSAIVIILSSPSFTLIRKKQILFIFVIYKVLCMLGGYRAFSLISILLTFYIYYKLCSPFKIKLKHILVAIIIIHLGSGMMKGIRDTRQQGVNVGTIFGSMFDMNNNAILSLLSDFGVSLSIISEVLESTNGLPIKGSYLIGSFTTIIPGASFIVGDAGYQNMDEELGLRNAGGSLIGDLVYDYGANNVVISSLLLGLIFGLIFEKFETSLSKLSPFLLAYLLPIMVDLLFCVRSSLAKMPREIVWYFLLLGFLTFFIPRRKVRVN